MPASAHAFAAIQPGGVIMHVGLQDWAGEIDMRKRTLAKITLPGTSTYTTADLRATVDALARGAFGERSPAAERLLDAGPQALLDLGPGRCASAKLLLRPQGSRRSEHLIAQDVAQPG